MVHKLSNPPSVCALSRLLRLWEESYGISIMDLPSVATGYSTTIQAAEKASLPNVGVALQLVPGECLGNVFFTSHSYVIHADIFLRIIAFVHSIWLLYASSARHPNMDDLTDIRELVCR
jgi:hypothetical protein